MAKVFLRLLTENQGETLDFTEIEDLIEFLKNKNWKLQLKKLSEGWTIQFVKEVIKR